LAAVPVLVDPAANVKRSIEYPPLRQAQLASVHAYVSRDTAVQSQLHLAGLAEPESSFAMHETNRWRSSMAI